jgi:hypothetical protein
VAETSDINREIEILETELKRLEAEYNMFFAGRLPRPPWETRTRVDGLVKRLDRMHMTYYGERFRFSSLQSRFARSIDLWDRGLRAREEGRSGPFAQSRSMAEKPQAAKDRVLTVATFSDPMSQMDKVQDLYQSLAEARREAGQEAIPFHKFAELIKTQVGAMKEKGNEEVAFRVALKDGKVAFTARAMRGAGKSEECAGGALGAAGGIAPGADRRRRADRVVVLGLADVPRLRTLRAVDDLEFDRLALFQGPETVATDGGVVDEHVAPTLALNEPIALRVIEPLDLACNTHRSSSLLALEMSFETQKKTASACAVSTATLRERPLTLSYPKHPPGDCQAERTAQRRARTP